MNLDCTAKDPWLHRDIAHSLAVSMAAVLLSAGLVYLIYLHRVYRVAARSQQHPAAAGTVLVFGKRLVEGQPDADFHSRLAHAHALASASPPRRLILLGGGPPGATEADAGLAALRRLGLPAHAVVQIEDRSLDTLQNLRNARDMLAAGDPDPVLLLSNRYHLARCASLARRLGLQHVPCAAEARFALREQGLSRLCREAAYLCWLEIGSHWAGLIGHRRMIDRVS